MQSQNPADLVLVPDSAGSELRRRLGLRDDAPLRLSYLPGPGDVAGTFAYWRAGRHDPRVPIAAYSLMLFELAARLRAQCQVVSLDPVGEAARTAAPQFRFDEVRERPATGRWSYLLSRHRLRRDLVAKVDAFDPHVVVTSNHVPTSAWADLGRTRRLVLSAHNTFWLIGRPPRTLRAMARLAQLTWRSRALDGATGVSEECARQIAQVTRGRIETHVARAQVLDTYPLRAAPRVRNILYLGRIEAAKGVFLLLDAFADLADEFPDLQLTIAGGGSDQARLEAMIRGSRHAGRVRYRGRVASEAVHLPLATSDLLVCPTLSTFSEGLPAVVCEAAAHGVPCVISSVVPATELLGEAGLVFTADNGADLRRVIGALIRDETAYRRACDATGRVRESIYDRSRSWGSQLYRCLIGDPVHRGARPAGGRVAPPET